MFEEIKIQMLYRKINQNEKRIIICKVKGGKYVDQLIPLLETANIQAYNKIDYYRGIINERN
jgi:hypothetical protein